MTNFYSLNEIIDISVMYISFFNIRNFFNVFVYISEINHLQSQNMSSIILFTVLWWGYAVFFTIIIQATWGYRSSHFREMKTSIFQVLATILF